jgi:hypothetical protein
MRQVVTMIQWCRDEAELFRLFSITNTTSGRTAGLVLLLVLEQSLQTSDIVPAVVVPYTNPKWLQKRPTSFQHDGMTWIGGSGRA